MKRTLLLTALLTMGLPGHAQGQIEGFVTRALSRHFGIKAGVTFDSLVETNNLQPVVLGTFRF